MAAASNDTVKGPWLVKSGDRILGPYSTDDLSRLIREKEVVVIDEIMAPQSRWAYVRDVEAFKQLVEEIRSGLMTAREDTEVAGYTSPAKSGEPIARTVSPDAVTKTATAIDTPTPTLTKTGTAVNLGEVTSASDDQTVVTQTNSDADFTNPNLGAAKPLAPKKPAEPAKPAASTAQNAAPAAASAASASAAATSSAPASPGKQKLAMDPLPHHNREAQKDQPVLTPTKNYIRPKMNGKAGVLLGSAVLICVVTLIIYTVLKSPQTAPSGANGENLGTQASVAWKRGEFDRALELYRALNANQPGQPQTAARLALLMMRLEGQTVEAKRVIESAQPNAQTDEDKSELAIASGLALLQTDDPKEAALKFSQAGSSWIAAFDEGVAQSALKNWNEAIKGFSQAGENAVAMLMLARTQLSAGDANAKPKPVARKEADEAIRKALIGAPDYQQESLLLASFIDAQSGNDKRAAKEILDAVETDPNQTGDHFHEPGLSLDQVSWSRLLPYCEQLNAQMNSKISSAMFGVCLAKANRIEDATKLIEGEVAKEPSNPYLHAVSAYLNTLADRDDAARASLTLSAKNGNSRLAQILSARLCMREKQDACAEEAWSKLASEPNPPIASITGLAQLRAQKGDKEGSSALLVKAESLSPTYLPLLRMREDASR